MSTGFCTLNSPWGPVSLSLRNGRLRQIELGMDRSNCGPVCALPEALAALLDEYFRTGKAPAPDGLDLDGCSEFDRTVYRQLLHVQAGDLTTYGELARRVGKSGAARAVGGALGRNPLPLLVPCDTRG